MFISYSHPIQDLHFALICRVWWDLEVKDLPYMEEQTLKITHDLLAGKAQCFRCISLNTWKRYESRNQWVFFMGFRWF